MGVVRVTECERARSWVSHSLDDELSQIEQASLRAHVGRCVACAGFERDVVGLTESLRAAVPQHPSTAVVLPRRRNATVRVLQVGAAAAAVVLAAGLGSLAGSLSSRNVPPATVARTGGDVVAMAPVQQLPAARIGRSVAL